MEEIETDIFLENSFPGVTLGALILKHGTILIDAPLRGEDARSWRAALISYGSDTNRMLVNLDAHPDRTLGARALEATIIAHQKTAQVFRGRPSVFKGQNAESGSEWETYNDAVGTRWALPDITFNQRLSLHWGPPDVVLEHHPGPAPGAIWVIVPEKKVIFVGDAVLYNQPPFLTNAEMPAWVEALELLGNEYADFIIISGRDGRVPIEAVHIQHKLLKNILKGLEKLAKKNSPTEATENLIQSLLDDFSYPAHLEEQYIQRLRHGLSQHYSRRYRPQDLANQMKPPENEG
jgi:glyoxylase-like metal-dependent hydrolase (beta-lactamase superfamily II)